MNTIVSYLILVALNPCKAIKSGQLLGYQSSSSNGNNIDGLFEIDLDTGAPDLDCRVGFLAERRRNGGRS